MAKKILLADDSITIQKVIELTFSDEDFDVVTVGNGRLALERAQEIQPDVVLCDVIMPEKDGYEVCEALKGMPGLAHVPVLLLTGAFEPFDQERATRIGADGFLAKPFEPQALVAKVKELLEKAPAAAAPPAVAAAAPAAAAPPPAPPAPPARPPAPPAPPAAPPVVEEAPATFADAYEDEAVAVEEGEELPASDDLLPAGLDDEAIVSAASPVDEDFYAGEPSGAEELAGLSDEEHESLGAPEPEPGPGAEDLVQEPTEAEPPAAETAPEAVAEPAAQPAPLDADEDFPAADLQSTREVPLEERAQAAAEATRPAPSAPVFDEVSEEEPEEAPRPAATLEAPASDWDTEEPAAPAPLAVDELDSGPEAPYEASYEEAPAPVPSEPEPPAPAVTDSFAGVAPAEPPEPAAAEPSQAAQVGVPADMVAQIAQRVVAQISDKVIREIAWEVVPDLAEALIKKEIERLKAELHNG